MVELPDGYRLVREGKNAVLAESESKKEYVAWTKAYGGGVCWGHYFSYYFDYINTLEQAYEKAVEAFKEKERS